MGFIDVPAAVTRADELLKEKDKIQKQIANVRELLRAAVADGDTSAEQTEWINETFPPQRTKTAEERIEAARLRLQEVEKKAAERAAKGNGSTATRSRAKAAA